MGQTTTERTVGHSYEEIRSCVLDLLSGREAASRYGIGQFVSLEASVAHVFAKRKGIQVNGQPQLDPEERELFREVFWDLFRQSIITIGLDYHNANFPFFSVSRLGKKLIDHQEAYFFHDLASYEKVIKDNVPTISDITLIYLKEAMQTYLSGCLLSSSVMLGVATEDCFETLIKSVESNQKHSPMFQSAFGQRALLSKFNKFRNILIQNIAMLPRELSEDLDVEMSGVLSIIRNFRNDSGHPTGKIVEREQMYVLLHIFVAYFKKIHALIDFFRKP